MDFKLKINEPNKLDINDYIHINVIYDGEHLSLFNSGNYPDPSIIHIVEKDGIGIVMIDKIPLYSVDLKSGYCIKTRDSFPTDALRVSSSLKTGYGFVEEKIIDREFYARRDIELEKKTQTELHTHFMEMLSGEEYLKILLNYVNGVYVDIYGNLLGAYPTIENILDLNHGEKFISANDILHNKELFNNISNQLSIRSDDIVDFSMIHTILCRRNALLDYAAYLAVESDFYETNLSLNELGKNMQVLKADKKTNIYVDILVKALESLRDKGIIYVELSFSTPNTIRRIQKEMKNKKVDGIEYKFLLSENRNKAGQAFREFVYDNVENRNIRNKKSVVKFLRDLIEDDSIVGFDLMGMEQYISEADYVPNSYLGSSLFDKLEQVVITLHDLSIEKKDPSLVCRLHSGEMYYPFVGVDGKGNPEKTLEILEAIQNKYKEEHGVDLVIPPPSIRIGHGLYFNRNDKHFIDLLKKYKVVAEINVSSNRTLGNVDTIRNIPYKWYKDNGIPFVLSTDGGGFYLTNPNDENLIAATFAGEDKVNYAINSEEYELEKRGL